MDVVEFLREAGKRRLAMRARGMRPDELVDAVLGDFFDEVFRCEEIVFAEQRYQLRSVRDARVPTPEPQEVEGEEFSAPLQAFTVQPARGEGVIS